MASTVQSTSGSAADIYAGLGLSRRSVAEGGSGTMQETQDRFLKLLVTQVKNQDPLNPMDQAEMTSQIAQINTVNGIEKLNTTMSSLVGSYQSGEAMQATAMIGSHVMVEGHQLDLTAAGGVAGYELSGPADKLKVSIVDGNGKAIRTLEVTDLDAGAGNFFWDGKTDGGADALAGPYRFEIEATRGDGAVAAKALTIGTVNAVTRTTTGYELDLGRLGSFAFDQVRQIM